MDVTEAAHPQVYLSESCQRAPACKATWELPWPSMRRSASGSPSPYLRRLHGAFPCRSAETTINFDAVDFTGEVRPELDIEE